MFEHPANAKFEISYNWEFSLIVKLFKVRILLNALSPIVVTVSGKNVARWLGDYAYLMYDEKFPTEVVGCYVTYEIYYHEAHGNNIRKARTREMIIISIFSVRCLLGGWFH